MTQYHIEKTQKIQDQVDKIYYESSCRWTTIFDDRKIYTSKSSATKDLYDFGGSVVKDVAYDPNASDGDGDGIVQDGTEFERSL